ncbi:ABC transporter permease [Oleidesulfovibrio sp.]|uniref:ABC transporter permease n=1 Tax=Oleidesulfovibrio sp. TaxID=2909707 RepID=UPI003A8A7D7F
MKRLYFAFLVVFFGLPVVVLTLYAVAPGWTWPHLMPRNYSLRALEYVWLHKGEIGTSIGSSLLYAGMTTVLSFALCLIPARHFARRTFKGRAVLEAVLLAPALVPVMTFAMGVHHVFIITGLADTMAGVVLVLTVFCYPYMLRALVAGFSSFGPEYDMCARNLGAGWWLRLTRVELPLLAPAIIAGGSVVFLIAFSDYFLVFLIGGGVVPSFTGYLFPLLNSSDRSLASVLALVFLILPVLLFLAVELLIARAYRKRGMY